MKTAISQWRGQDFHLLVWGVLAGLEDIVSFVTHTFRAVVFLFICMNW